jgi:hypothetical protein
MKRQEKIVDDSITRKISPEEWKDFDDRMDEVRKETRRKFIESEKSANKLWI